MCGTAFDEPTLTKLDRLVKERRKAFDRKRRALTEAREAEQAFVQADRAMRREKLQVQITAQEEQLKRLYAQRDAIVLV